MFPDNAYVVLDLPSPVARRVLAAREAERDPFRFSLPAEITVAGSGGVGCIATDESEERVVSTLGDIALRTQPLRCAFGPVRRFPHSDVFYLSLADESSLRLLHERIADSGLRFQPTPFSFIPHCTLRSRAPVGEPEARALLGLRVHDRFVLDQLSVYQLRGGGASLTSFATLCCLLYRARLRG